MEETKIGAQNNGIKGDGKEPPHLMPVMTISTTTTTTTIKMILIIGRFIDA